MTWFLRLLLLMVIPLFFCTGCPRLLEDSGPTHSADLPAGEEPIDFPTKTVRIKDEALVAEIAQSPAQRERGLMYRKSLPNGHGMLFIFDRPEYLSFWMKNTFIPLSIAFIDTEQTIVDIQDMQPVEEGTYSFPVYISKAEAKYALEVPKGWFQKHSIKVGDKVEWSL